jgi:hypothetical protein
MTEYLHHHHIFILPGCSCIKEMRTKASELASRIMKWNREDVHELLLMIEELDTVVDQHFPGEKFIDLSHLPTVPVPDLDVACAPYPVWAMDIHEMCLAGDNDLFIESLEHIMYGHPREKCR